MTQTQPKKKSALPVILTLALIMAIAVILVIRFVFGFQYRVENGIRFLGKVEIQQSQAGAWRLGIRAFPVTPTGY